MMVIGKMKQIQWFPGHMAKTYRELQPYLKVIDLVLVVLDSRVPHSSVNQELLKRVKHKPILLLFNKVDLVDFNELQPWLNYYNNLGFNTLAINSLTGQNVNRIVKEAEKILADKRERLSNRGRKKDNYRLMIIGIPNSGKSSLINRLTNKKAANTANIAGVTKHIQWYRINPKFDLLDTPGLLWHKFDNEDIGYRLAITGAIKDDILPTDDIVRYLLNFLRKKYPHVLKERYDADPNLSNIEILDHIGSTRGALMQGGVIDYERVYQMLITDCRNLRLGKLIFDELN